MKVVEAKVVGGKVVSDRLDLEDGTAVFIVSGDSAALRKLSAAELSELEAGIAEADRGQLINGDDFLEELRRFEAK